MFYDSAVWELMWPLMNGGKAVMPSDEEEQDVDGLVGLLDKQAVTIADFVPSVFNALLPDWSMIKEAEGTLRSLRVLIVGGEEIKPASIYRFMHQYPAVRVMNVYARKKASMGCISYDVTGMEMRQDTDRGKPHSECYSVLILDQNNRALAYRGEGKGRFIWQAHASGFRVYLHD